MEAPDGKAMEIVRTKDSGTLQYEIFLNEDETEAVVFERYRDAGSTVGSYSVRRPAGDGRGALAV